MHVAVLEQSRNWFGHGSCIAVESPLELMWCCQYENQRLEKHLHFLLSIVDLLVFLPGLILTGQCYPKVLLILFNLNCCYVIVSLLHFHFYLIFVQTGLSCLNICFHLDLLKCNMWDLLKSMYGCVLWYKYIMFQLLMTGILRQ